MSKDGLKAMRITSEMRTNLTLMSKSNKVTGPEFMAVKNDCIQYLANSNLNYPPSMSKFGLYQGQPLPLRKQALGIEENREEPTPEELEFQDFLAVKAKKSIKANWIWRIGQECQEKAYQGWYGFFVTLTVDPSRIADSQTMWEEGREFRKYIRRLAKVSAKACGQPRAIHNGASASDYVHHVGVIEHGKSRQHHHMHLLVWMRNIPDSWKKCPNSGIRNPKHRIVDWCKPMTTYWPNSLPGIGKAKYFRHECDMWSQHRFVLPYDPKKKAVIKIHGPETAGLYIAKYMDKDDKVWTHRIKATRNLGLTRLRIVLMQMHWQKVEALSWRPESYHLSTLATTIHTVPNGLLRLIAKQEVFCRLWARKQLDWNEQLQKSCDAFSKMQQSVKNGARPKRMRTQEFYEWVTKHLPEQKGYCEQRYKRAIQSLGANFAPKKSSQVNHIGMV